MNSELNLNNFKSFFKYNKMTILFFTIIFSIIFLLGSIFLHYNNTEEINNNDVNEERLEELGKIDAEDLTSKELTEYKELLSEGAYYFRVYIEHENGGALTAPYLLEEIIQSEDVTNFVEKEAGTKFTIDPKVSVSVIKQNSNVIMEVQVGTGDKVANQKLADAYFKAFQEEITPFLKNKETYVLSDSIQMRENEDSRDVLNNNLSQGSERSWIEYILMAIMGSFVGIIFGLFISMLIGILGKKVNSLFEYRNDPNDMIIRFTDSNDNQKQLIHSIEYPLNNKKIILSETQLSEEIMDQINLQDNILQIGNDVSNLDPALVADEIIILINENITSKKWYHSQRVQLKSYNTNVKIIVI